MISPRQRAAERENRVARMVNQSIAATETWQVVHQMMLAALDSLEMPEGVTFCRAGSIEDVRSYLNDLAPLSQSELRREAEEAAWREMER